MVTVKYLGRLGNNLFQYALGRIIAESLDYPLQASAIDGFDGTFDIVKTSEETYAGALMPHNYIKFSNQIWMLGKLSMMPLFI